MYIVINIAMIANLRPGRQLRARDKSRLSTAINYCNASNGSFYQERTDAVTMATLRAPAAAAATPAVVSENERHSSSAHPASRSTENGVDGWCDGSPAAASAHRQR